MTAPTMHAVSSSNIQSIGHDADSSTLHVIFNDNSHYTYDGVDEAAFDAFHQSGSHGKHFHSQIKGQYPPTKVG